MLLLRMLLLRIGVDGCERRAAPGCRATRVLGRPRCSEPTSPITASASGTHLAGVHGASTVRKRKRRERETEIRLAKPHPAATHLPVPLHGQPAVEGDSEGGMGRRAGGGGTRRVRGSSPRVGT